MTDYLYRVMNKILLYFNRVVTTTNVQQIVDRNVLVALCVIFGIFSLALIAAVVSVMICKFRKVCKVRAITAGFTNLCYSDPSFFVPLTLFRERELTSMVMLVNL